MPPTKQDTPETIRPYEQHGIDLNYRKGDKNPAGLCPFCMKENKFTVAVDNGMWRCLSCNIGSDNNNKSANGGNLYTFLRLLHHHSLQASPSLDELAEDRGISVGTLKTWGVTKSLITGEWIVPAYNLEGKLNNLYRYVRLRDKMRLLGTVGIGHQIFGANQYDFEKEEVFICEGPWDGMKLYDVLCRMTSEYRVAVRKDKSVLKYTNIISLPGDNGFNEKWSGLFPGKHVYLLFDNDHERNHPTTGKVIPSAGYMGMKRIAGLLTGSETPPAKVHYLDWGPRGFDASLPSGYDVRDFLSA